MMPRGYPHPPSVRAQAMADFYGGMNQADVAAKYHVPKSTLTLWIRLYDPNHPTDTRTSERIADLLYQQVELNLAAMQVLVSQVADEAWLREQTADGIARMYATFSDRTLRIMAGFRPVDQAKGQGQQAIEGEVVASDGE